MAVRCFTVCLQSPERYIVTWCTCCTDQMYSQGASKEKSIMCLLIGCIYCKDLDCCNVLKGIVGAETIKKWEIMYTTRLQEETSSLLYNSAVAKKERNDVRHIFWCWCWILIFMQQKKSSQTDIGLKMYTFCILSETWESCKGSSVGWRIWNVTKMESKRWHCWVLNYKKKRLVPSSALFFCQYWNNNNKNNKINLL